MKTMLKMLGVVAVVLAAQTFAEEEHPYKKAKIGDWISYKITSQMPQGAMTGEMKQTVIEKTDTEAKLEITSKMAGLPEQKNTITVKLNEKFDPNKMQEGVEVKETGKGEETIKIGDKEYKTKWVTADTTAKQGQFEMKGKTKSWVCPDVPLGGLVKSEMVMTMGAMNITTNTELIGSGSK